MTNKTCSKCLQAKPLSEFNRHARDGYSQPCKECKKQKQKTQAEIDAIKNWKKTPLGKESARRSAKKHYWSHPEKRRAYHKEYYSLYREKYLDRYTKSNRKQQHLRRLTKAFATIAQEAILELQNNHQS